MTITPLLTTHITLAQAPRPEEESLNAVLDAIGPSAKMTINRLPTKPSMRKVLIGAADEPAIDVLVRIGRAFGPFSCHLLYDPPSHQYYANLERF